MRIAIKYFGIIIILFSVVQFVFSQENQAGENQALVYYYNVIRPMMGAKGGQIQGMIVFLFPKK